MPPVQVIFTQDFSDWFDGLAEQEAAAVLVSAGLLRERGVALGYPYSSQIKGSKYPIRELRIQVGGHPLRVLYAFDPRRNAVLLMGGDKTGDNRFYEKMIPNAEKIFEEHLEAQAKEVK